MNSTEHNTGQASAPVLSRRSFLGGMAITAIPSAAVAIDVENSHNETMTAQERAEFHWNAFAAAMDKLTSDYDGWFVNGGARVSSKTGERVSHRSQNSISMMPEKIGSMTVNIERHSPMFLKGRAKA